MVFREMRGRGVSTPIIPPSLIGPDNHKCIGDKTPTEASVQFCLEWLQGHVDRNHMIILEQRWTDREKDWITKKTSDGTEYLTKDEEITELDKLGIEVVSICGLMMGCCHLICEVKSEHYSEKLIQEVVRIVNSIFKKFIVYHNKDE
jgi:hypothetical protein